MQFTRVRRCCTPHFGFWRAALVPIWPPLIQNNTGIIEQDVCRCARQCREAGQAVALARFALMATGSPAKHHNQRGHAFIDCARRDVTQYVGSMLMCAVSRAHSRALSPTICARCGRLWATASTYRSTYQVHAASTSLHAARHRFSGARDAIEQGLCHGVIRREMQGRIAAHQRGARVAPRVPAECAPDAQSRKCAAMRRAAVVRCTNPLQDLQCTRTAETRLRPPTMTMCLSRRSSSSNGISNASDGMGEPACWNALDTDSALATYAETIARLAGGLHATRSADP